MVLMTKKMFEELKNGIIHVLVEEVSFGNFNPEEAKLTLRVLDGPLKGNLIIDWFATTEEED
jgi:hypothetical protein